MSRSENYQIGEKEKAALCQTRIFRGLQEQELEAVLKQGFARGVRFEKDATVAEAESHRDEFMILLSGRIQGVREQENGIKDFVQLYVPGEILGLDIVCSATRRCPFRLQALDETNLVCINYDEMFSNKISALTEKKLREGVTGALANESLRRLHKIDVLYRRSLRDRIWIYLWNLSLLTGSNHIETNMDREQFAQYLGVNRSALSHELSNMRKDGLIDFKKGSFTILGKHE